MKGLQKLRFRMPNLAFLIKNEGNIDGEKIYQILDNLGRFKPYM